jgi:hypothetical protein
MAEKFEKLRKVITDDPVRAERLAKATAEVAARQEQADNTICVECGGPESKHSYSPPGWDSSDGLPIFEGCFCQGTFDTGNSETDWDYPIPICSCTDFDPGDDE